MSTRLLVPVEAGEDVIISRGNDPIVGMSRISKESDLQLLINKVRAARLRAMPSTNEETLSWRDEGRR